MTQQSVSCIFVIRFELERFRQLPDRSDDRICPLVLQKALLHRHYPVRAFLIGSRHDPPAFLKIEDRMYFVAVVRRLLHADDLLPPAVWLQQLLRRPLLFLKLPVIR